MIQILGDLRSFAAACLAYYNDDWERLDQVEQRVPVPRNGEQGWRLEEAWDEGVAIHLQV